jgi:hypothetical protein
MHKPMHFEDVRLNLGALGMVTFCSLLSVSATRDRVAGLFEPTNVRAFSIRLTGRSRHFFLEMPYVFFPNVPLSVRPTDLTLSCAARARVPKPERRGGCRE